MTALPRATSLVLCPALAAALRPALCRAPAGALCRALPAALRAVLLTALVAAAAGCGGQAGAAGPARPEKSSVVVAAVPGEGAAGLYIAQAEGLFRRAGLNVRIAPTSQAALVRSVVNGDADVASGPYNDYIAADAAGPARIRILAAGYSLGTRAQEIMVAPHSSITTVNGLRGATIAVDSVNGQTTDLLYAALTGYGITPSEVRVVSAPFTDMPHELAAGRVDAIYEIEPYVTEAAEQYGDLELADIDAGAAQGLPLSGYGVLASWAARHPRTTSAFAAAIRQANTIAATSPAALETALNAALHLTPIVTAVMATGTFPTVTFATQLQRVANLMLRYGQLKRPFSVQSITGP
jgi:NitT/TauT family transport system substrate-binding protein